MSHIPRSKEVAQAIRSVRREVKAAVKEANQQAANRLARGDYTAAQTLIEVAKSISQFEDDVEALRARWQGLRSPNTKTNGKKVEQTPLWEFYGLSLKALVSLGGEATKKDIIDKMEGTIIDQLKEGDFVPSKNGTPRWKRMVGQCRKHMISEGFLEDNNGWKWQITKKGRQAAKAGVKN